MRQHPSTAALVNDEARLSYDGKLIVFTSFYDHKGHAAYTQCLTALAIQLERLGVRWDFWPSQGDFHIERCVNDAYTRFLNDPEATDIINIDSDESFDPMGVIRLLSYPEEVVAGAYKMKNNWQDWTAQWMVNQDNGHPIGRVLDAVKQEALLEAFRVPWGFLRVKKSALQKYVEKFPDLWFDLNGKKTHIFCELKYINNAMFSQDYVFSERLKEAGLKLWIDPNITIGHWGYTEHVGNLHEYLLSAAKNQADGRKFAEHIGGDEKVAQAFATVRQMAREIEERKAA